MAHPKANIDESLLYCLILNGASVAQAAKEVGCHRDTLYTRFFHTITEAREAHSIKWGEIVNEKKRLKRERARLKRLEYDLSYNRWIRKDS